MASTDAKPIPRKNVAFRLGVDLWLTTGLVNSGAAGLDSEISKDNGTFTDCTNEATEVATSSGTYYLDLTSTEMNADIVQIQVKSSTTNAITAKYTIYPAEATDIGVDVTSWNGTAIPGVDTAGYPKVTIKDGTGPGEIDTTSGGVLVAAVAASAINRAALAADTGLQTVRSNTAQAGAAGTVTLDAGASATTDFYKGSWISLTGGTGVGQARLCTAYNGTTKVATIAPNWATNPDNTSTFGVLPAAGVDFELIQGATINTSTAQLGVNVVNAAGTAWNSGAIGASTLANGTITAASIAADAITDAKVASDVTIASVTGAVGSVTAAVTVGTINNGVITANSIAADAITDAKVASDVTIASVTGSVGSVAAGGITASSIATDAIGSAELASSAVDKIVDAIWDEAQSGHTTAGTFGKFLDAAISGVSTGGISAGDIADAVWDEAGAGHVTAGTFGARLDALISSRMATFTLPANFSTLAISGAGAVTVGTISNGVITAASIAADAITDAKVASDVTIASVTGSVGSVTGAVTVGTINNGVITANSIAADAITDAKVASDVTIASVGSVTNAVTVGTINNGVITAASIANDAITDAKVASDVTIASVTGSVGSVASAVTITGDAATAGTRILTTLELISGSNYRFKAAALSQAPVGEGGGGGGLGTGAWPIPLEIVDDDGPLENAQIRFLLNGSTSAQGSTDAAGAIEVALDPGTYKVAVTLAHFNSAIATLVVGDTGEASITEIELVRITAADSPDPDFCLVTGKIFARDGVTPLEDKVLRAKFNTTVEFAGRLLSTQTAFEARSNADGEFELSVPRTDLMTPTTALCVLEVPEAGYKKSTTTAAGSLPLGSLLAT